MHEFLECINQFQKRTKSKHLPDVIYGCSPRRRTGGSSGQADTRSAVSLHLYGGGLTPEAAQVRLPSRQSAAAKRRLETDGDRLKGRAATEERQSLINEHNGGEEEEEAVVQVRATSRGGMHKVCAHRKGEEGAHGKSDGVREVANTRNFTYYTTYVAGILF